MLESVNALTTCGSRSAGSAAFPTSRVWVRIPASAGVSRRSHPWNARRHGLFIDGVLVGFFLADATGLGDQPRLFHEDLVSGYAGAGHHHDERDIPVPGSYHRRNNATLAVADESDFARVHFGARLEIRDASLRVGGKVGGCAGEQIG